MTGLRTLSDGREICRTREAWNLRRREILKRDRFRCCTCGRLVAETAELAAAFNLPLAHVHHKKRRGMGGGKRDDRPENLLTQCSGCHAREHGA